MLVRRTLEAMTPISRDTWLFVLSLVWLVVLLWRSRMCSASGEFKRAFRPSRHPVRLK